MNVQNLQELLAAGPVAIEFGECAEDLEAYVDPKMRAHVMSVRVGPDDVAVLRVDYSAYDEYNKAFEKANYYDKNGNPTLTARETGNYDFQEDLYVSASEELDHILTALPGISTQLLEEFNASGQTGYVRWLEEQLIFTRTAGVK
ncbi:hypothetical protein PZF67_005271 [Pseudomonas aeruginosa]|uniref:hypothetical protein n=1 Tax=Pseudomonas aeruginosa TaxID=287 RepID=UPI0025C9F2AF|nr:hypothetical protein [Pseudomonas aeruginosa]